MYVGTYVCVGRRGAVVQRVIVNMTVLSSIHIRGNEFISIYISLALVTIQSGTLSFLYSFSTQILESSAESREQRVLTLDSLSPSCQKKLILVEI